MVTLEQGERLIQDLKPVRRVGDKPPAGRPQDLHLSVRRQLVGHDKGVTKRVLPPPLRTEQVHDRGKASGLDVSRVREPIVSRPGKARTVFCPREGEIFGRDAVLPKGCMKNVETQRGRTAGGHRRRQSRIVFLRVEKTLARSRSALWTRLMAYGSPFMTSRHAS